MRRLLLGVYQLLWVTIRPLIYRLDAMTAHAYALKLLMWLDSTPLFLYMIRLTAHTAAPRHEQTVGGVTLPYPIMLAAGLVKGTGYSSEEEALKAVNAGENIIPGWRSMPTLVGAVEFGSYTRYPRVGNSGTVLWRLDNGLSLQNRVGLKNPGAQAAAAFLARKHVHLPPVFGLNIAVSPGLDDSAQEAREFVDSLHLFLDAGIRPSWVTLNISCPNTENDPDAMQTAGKIRILCGAAQTVLHPQAIPLWIKISPGLTVVQADSLTAAFIDTGVRAVIATNTRAEPSPDDLSVMAGVSGARLRREAYSTAGQMVRAIQRANATIDVITCGGIQTGSHWKQAGKCATQIYTALVHRGPLAAALIQNEADL